MSAITKLSQKVTQYYNNITSQYGSNARIQKIYNNEQYKRRLRIITRKL